MMDADGANIRHNEVLGEVAVLCKGCQVAILNQIGDIRDEGTRAPRVPPTALRRLRPAPPRPSCAATCAVTHRPRPLSWCGSKRVNLRR